MNIDVYFEEGELLLCHGSCLLGSTALDAALGGIRVFLEAEPREILFVDLQNKAPVDEVSAAFDAAGLLAFVHEQSVGEPWPSLGEMIDSGRRLVVFSGDTDGPTWLHYGGDFIYATAWGSETVEDMTCELTKPAFPHGLFELNHNLTNPVASEDLANQVNWNPFLAERVEACTAAQGHRVNLLSVDYYSIGDVLDLVGYLNAE